MERKAINFEDIKPYLEKIVIKYGYVKDNEKSCKAFRKYVHPSGDRILLPDLKGKNYYYFRNMDIQGDVI